MFNDQLRQAPGDILACDLGSRIRRQVVSDDEKIDSLTEVEFDIVPQQRFRIPDKERHHNLHGVIINGTLAGIANMVPRVMLLPKNRRFGQPPRTGFFEWLPFSMSHHFHVALQGPISAEHGFAKVEWDSSSVVAGLIKIRAAVPGIEEMSLEGQIAPGLPADSPASSVMGAASIMVAR
jgi:hypothetical protein